MDEIIFQKLKSTVDGVGATTGKQTETAFNENFELVKSLFTQILVSLSLTVVSQEIKQLRVDTATNPYTLYYSLDDLDVADPTWIKLLNFSFAQLTGSPMDNIALKTILDSKASQGSLDTLTLQVTGCIDSVTALTSLVNNINNTELPSLKDKDRTLEASIKANKDSIDAINADLENVVLTQAGDSLWIRYNSGDNILEISINQGTSWTPVGTLNMTWTQISGDPSESESLSNFISEAITNAVANFITTETFSNHVSDTNNPHNVTAAQLGLGNVLDLINKLEGSESTIIYGKTSSFLTNIDKIPLGKAYFTSSHFDRVPLTIEGEDYYDFVQTITPDESYTGPDEFTITVEIFNTAPETIPTYYHVFNNDDISDNIDIYFNETLYNYIEEGGKLE